MRSNRNFSKNKQWLRQELHQRKCKMPIMTTSMEETLLEEEKPKELPRQLHSNSLPKMTIFGMETIRTEKYHLRITSIRLTSQTLNKKTLFRALEKLDLESN